MAEEHTDFYEEMLPWFEYKVMEFSDQGYDNIGSEDLYQCFKNYIWKHSVPQHYYQKVFDVMKFNVNQYFDYESLEAQVYKVAALDEIDFEEFL